MGARHIASLQTTEPCRTFVETLCKPLWNPCGTLWNPVEPCRTLPQGHPGPVKPWWNPRGTLPQTTPDHPAALAEPGGTLLELWWNPGGTLVEPWWNPRGTLPQGRPGPPRSLSGLRPQSFQLLGKKEEEGNTYVHIYATTCTYSLHCSWHFFRAFDWVKRFLSNGRIGLANCKRPRLPLITAGLQSNNPQTTETCLLGTGFYSRPSKRLFMIG